MNLLSTLKKDIRVVFERDPAAKSIFEVPSRDLKKESMVI